MRSALRFVSAIVGAIVWIVGALIFGGDEPAELK